MDVNVSIKKIAVSDLGQGFNLVEFDVWRTTGTRTERVSISLAAEKSGKATLRETQDAATRDAIALLQSTLAEAWPAE
jgi:hypothetical protein